MWMKICFKNMSDYIQIYMEVSTYLEIAELANPLLSILSNQKKQVIKKKIDQLDLKSNSFFSKTTNKHTYSTS